MNPIKYRIHSFFIECRYLLNPLFSGFNSQQGVLNPYQQMPYANFLNFSLE